MKNVAVKENHLYQKAYAKGKKAVGRYVVIYVMKDLKASAFRRANPRKVNINRVGLTVTKKIGGAVVRSRVKRVIRAGLAEAKAHAPLKTGYLIVIAARVGAHEASGRDMGEELIKALTRLEMYKTPKQPQDKEMGK